MEHIAYITAMCVSLACFAWCDHRYKLAFFWNARRTLAILLIMQAVFVVWDVVNLSYGTFFTNQDWVTGLYVVTPNMPIEELIFFVFLDYQVLLLWRWLCTRTSR